MKTDAPTPEGLEEMAVKLAGDLWVIRNEFEQMESQARDGAERLALLDGAHAKGRAASLDALRAARAGGLRAAEDVTRSEQDAAAIRAIRLREAP